MNRISSSTRIGVIGCGHWGKNYLRNFSALPNAELTAICDLNDTVLNHNKRVYPSVSIFSDYRSLIESGKCDAVVVSTVASTHYDIVKHALDCQQHVIAEKPLALRVEEADELVRRATAANRILLVAHTFLFNAGVRQMRRYIKEGILGDVYYLKARRTHLGLIREDVNVVWDLAPHDIAVLMYLLDEAPVKIQAMGGKFLKKTREDVAFINLSFPSGTIGNITVSWADPNKERYFDAVGSKARIVFNDLDNLEPIRIFNKGVSINGGDSNFGEFQYLLRDGDILSPRTQLEEPLRVLCLAFLDAIHYGKTLVSDGAFGADVVRVLSRIDQALLSPGQEVKYAVSPGQKVKYATSVHTS